MNSSNVGQCSEFAVVFGYAKKMAEGMRDIVSAVRNGEADINSAIASMMKFTDVLINVRATNTPESKLLEPIIEFAQSACGELIAMQN